jgi:hypothetical protein
MPFDGGGDGIADVVWIVSAIVLVLHDGAPSPLQDLRALPKPTESWSCAEPVFKRQIC